MAICTKATASDCYGFGEVLGKPSLWMRNDMIRVKNFDVGQI